ncbi:hypothetical protein [uncultured Tateyamaria sp.]|uniref:hypothetical protein n=1 Tax=uncultured Tateyamaria sp. TaxID=455651 RepID=UPI00261D38B3|nr:hypothetical protein [uncultured Tateyamaria sp.]
MPQEAGAHSSVFIAISAAIVTAAISIAIAIVAAIIIAVIVIPIVSFTPIRRTVAAIVIRVASQFTNGQDPVTITI